MFMRAMVSEIVGGSARPPPLVEGVGTKRLGKGRVKKVDEFVELFFYMGSYHEHVIYVTPPYQGFKVIRFDPLAPVKTTALLLPIE